MDGIAGDSGQRFKCCSKGSKSASEWVELLANAEQTVSLQLCGDQKPGSHLLHELNDPAILYQRDF